jgi:anti-sigma B factor antagonist
MEVNSRVANGAVVVVVQGEVDLYSSPKLRHEIVHWAGEEMLSLIVDLEAVTYMDSSGIATLVEGFQLAKRHGGKFGLARPGASIQEVLRFAHLDKIIPTFDSVEQALGRE